MDIREAAPDDAPAIAAVARASWHAAYDDLLGAETVDATVDDWYDPEALREQVSRENAVFLVAVVDGSVVGFTDAGPAGDNDPHADAFISRLYVEPDRWGAGIGTELTAAVARRLRAAGHETVWLEVFAENDAGKSFYEGAGFERVGATEETFGGTTLQTLSLAAPLASLAALDGRR